MATTSYTMSRITSGTYKGAWELTPSFTKNNYTKNYNIKLSGKAITGNILLNCSTMPTVQTAAANTVTVNCKWVAENTESDYYKFTPYIYAYNAYSDPIPAKVDVTPTFTAKSAIISGSNSNYGLVENPTFKFNMKTAFKTLVPNWQPKLIILKNSGASNGIEIDYCENGTVLCNMDVPDYVDGTTTPDATNTIHIYGCKLVVNYRGTYSPGSYPVVANKTVEYSLDQGANIFWAKSSDDNTTLYYTYSYASAAENINGYSWEEYNGYNYYNVYGTATSAEIRPVITGNTVAVVITKIADHLI